MKRCASIAGALALLTLVGSCGTDETDLTAAENFDQYPLCTPPLDVQNAPICERNPVRNNVRAGYREIRGALVDSGSPGGGVNLYTSRTTITIFRSKAFPIQEIVSSLRPVRGTLSADDDLPPPAFPRSMLRKLRRNKEREDRRFMRQLAALAKMPPAPC